MAMSGFAYIECMKVVNKKTLKCITLQKQLWNHLAFLLLHLFSLLLSRPLIYRCVSCSKKVGAVNTNRWSWRPCSRLTLYWLLTTLPQRVLGILWTIWCLCFKYENLHLELQWNAVSDAFSLFFFGRSQSYCLNSECVWDTWIYLE